MKRIFSVVMLLACYTSEAQVRTNDYNSIGWYSLVTLIKISDKWTVNPEYQWRRTQIIKNWQQSLTRFSLDYSINKNVSVAAGYAWIKTFPYGEHTLAVVPKSFSENTAFEQVVLHMPVGKTKITNRLRFEQRWTQKYSNASLQKPDETFYRNRVRYMNRIDIPFNKQWYTAAYDEILIGFGKHVGENVFDQNRIVAVLGYRFNTHIKTEAGYINQVIQLGREVNNQNVFQHNNGIVITTTININ